MKRICVPSKNKLFLFQQHEPSEGIIAKDILKYSAIEFRILIVKYSIRPLYRKHCNYINTDNLS